MIPSRNFSSTILALALAASPLRATQSKPPEPPRAPEAESPVEKGLKSRLFEVKYRDPNALRMALRPLGSGVRGSAVEMNPELKTISVHDFPENIAVMEEALKRLDRPEAAAHDVELRMHVLAASRAASSDGDLPAELKDVVAALRGTLSYKGYRLLTTFTERVKDGTRGVHGGGVITLEEANGKRETVQAEFGILGLSVADPGTAPALVRLEGFKLVFSQSGRAEIATDVSLKEGEQVVVGTSVYHDQGLVVVLSAHVAR
jgi:hypothetical protein